MSELWGRDVRLLSNLLTKMTAIEAAIFLQINGLRLDEE